MGQSKDIRPVEPGRQSPVTGRFPSDPRYKSPSKRRSVQRRRLLLTDSESDTDLPYRHQRPRATGTIHHDTSYRPEVTVVDVHSSDTKLDREIRRQQKDIDRLEEDLRLHKLKLDIESEREFENKISERLKRLDEMEREEERTNLKRAERRAEEQSKRKEEIKAALREKEWKEMKKKKEEEGLRARIRKELHDEEIRRKFEERERFIHENKIRRAAIEDYKLAEEQRLLEEERQKRQLKKEYRAAIEAELGYSLEQVKDILTKATGKKAQRQSRGRSQAFSATVHDVSSGDEADVEAP
ncbi:uncharacterized protein AKAW2_10742A [Aspergillus luchuensis]|uniref:Similar to An02g08770 n=1 Tax=Aspergillus kawachii TaxID=1069201 RepID=A0A146FCL7_ASPKA|nr:uncharacterized protein AKAW2_10742A [Aspergillus luchuensis]BCR93696.1 hypothetical protein AKAW2_10742A [Aspergillus luchuensis]BCS06323.1 hypothetical protein ALUC_10704A [Aspergillus luchuensis]GAA84651.1 similar to An02g08770 [Aspergillus luchuensis IFO 4308]GAT23635.1 similar to An02g08770 [Aspergillus luchuensis]